MLLMGKLMINIEENLVNYNNNNNNKETANINKIYPFIIMLITKINDNYM